MRAKASFHLLPFHEPSNVGSRRREEADTLLKAPSRHFDGYQKGKVRGPE